MPSLSIHTHRVIGGMTVIALVILVGPLLKPHSSERLFSQVASCPPGMPYCSDLGCRSEGANCRSPRNCCDPQGNITLKLPCCNASFICSDNYICVTGSGGGGSGGPPPPPGGSFGGIAGDGTGTTDCFSDTDCLDGDSCTIDRCVSGSCLHEPDISNSDGDAAPDCTDQCPFDPLKIEPGQCGCHNEETPTCGNSSPPPPPPSPSPSPPAPAPSPDPSPPSPSLAVSSAPQPPATLPPIASDCTKCSSVREVCAKSGTFTYIHHTQTLCACFDAWTSPEGWLLCVWQDSPLSSLSSRPLPPPPLLRKPSSRSSSSAPLAPRSSLSEVGSSSLPSRPPVCGDGFIQPPNEECDDGIQNSYAPNSCRPYCQKAWCGDGITDDATEDCDAGAVCIGGLLDGPQCAGFGCVRGDPNCISPEACEKGGGTCDFVGDSVCTLYCTNRKGPSSASSASSLPLGLIEFFQKSCQRCGDGFFNLCDKKECESFGPCNFTESVLGTMWGTCVVKET